MRFSYLVGAAALALAAPPVPAQDGQPVGQLETVEPALAATAPAAFEHPEGCLTEITGAFENYLGPPVAWPEDGQTVHTPAGLSVLDRPVSYVLVKRDDAAGPVSEVAYRLQGMTRKVGQPHDSALLKAFDGEFKSADCAGSTQSSCGVVYRPNGKPFNGAEIGSGEIDVAGNARGPSLALIKADYDLMDADPVFLVCFYRGD